MQGTYYQVSGNRRLNRDARCLLVSDLTDHDDIRVLTKDGTQGTGEGQVCLRIYMYLIDTVDIRLYRVFDSDNIYILGVQFTEGCIQGSGFTGTGRSGNQQNSVRILQNMVKLLHLRRLQSKLALLSVQSSLGSKSHNCLLAVHGRKDRYTDIILGTVYHLGNTSVLRFSLLGDIHAADDLNTCRHSGQNLDIITGFLIQGSVDAVANTDALLQRLDVNIGGSLPGCLLDQISDQHNHRRGIDIL